MLAVCAKGTRAQHRRRHGVENRLKLASRPDGQMTITGARTTERRSQRRNGIPAASPSKAPAFTNKIVTHNATVPTAGVELQLAPTIARLTRYWTGPRQMHGGRDDGDY